MIEVTKYVSLADCDVYKVKGDPDELTVFTTIFPDREALVVIYKNNRVLIAKLHDVGTKVCVRNRMQAMSQTQMVSLFCSPDLPDYVSIEVVKAYWKVIQ